MAVIGDILFWSGRSRPDLSGILRHNLEKEVAKKVDQLPASTFDGRADQDIVKDIVEECEAEPLSLRLDEAEADVREKPIVVNDVFGGTVNVPGLRVAKVIPFDGEAAFFKMTPNTWDTNPPHGQVTGNKLTVGMEVRESEAESAMQYIDQTVTRIQEHISRQKPQIDEYNGRLPSVATEAIQRRRGSLGKASDLAARLRGK